MRRRDLPRVDIRGYSGYRPKVGGRQFYLGDDNEKAHVLYNLIRSEWRRLRSEGVKAWPQMTLDQIEDARTKLYVPTPKAAEVRPISSATPAMAGFPDCSHETSLTLHSLLEDFIRNVKTDPRRSTAWRRSLTLRLGRIKSAFPDRPLDGIKYEALTEMVNHYVALPNGKNAKQLATETAWSYIMTLRLFFNWADRTDRWIAPRHFNSIFKVDRRVLDKNSGRPSTGEVKVFTVEELTIIWNYIGAIQESYQNRRKLLMVLSLNTGMTQHEIAQLRKDEINFVTGQIKRLRYKTGVLGCWHLWPETIKLLRAEIDTSPNQPIALLTAEGTPLVQYHADRNKSDSVGLSWTRTMRCVNKINPQVRKLGFKYLRKTGSDLVRRVGGLEMAEAFLCHSERSLSRVYNNRDFERLGECLTMVRQQLTPIFRSGESSPDKPPLSP